MNRTTVQAFLVIIVLEITKLSPRAALEYMFLAGTLTTVTFLGIMYILDQCD